MRWIHRSPVNSQHKGQWRGALMFSLICAWMNDWVNNGEAGDFRRHCAHYDVIVMKLSYQISSPGAYSQSMYSWLPEDQNIADSFLLSRQTTSFPEYDRRRYLGSVRFYKRFVARLTKTYDVTIQRYHISHAKVQDSKVHILRIYDVTRVLRSFCLFVFYSVELEIYVRQYLKRRRRNTEQSN